MKRSGYPEEQIVNALSHVEGVTPVGDLCRQLRVSDATFYAWKKTYAHLGASELRQPHSSLGHLTPKKFVIQR